jgi:hypothetical protein
MTHWFMRWRVTGQLRGDEYNIRIYREGRRYFTPYCGKHAWASGLREWKIPPETALSKVGGLSG